MELSKAIETLLKSGCDVVAPEGTYRLCSWGPRGIILLKYDPKSNLNHDDEEEWKGDLNEIRPKAAARFAELLSGPTVGREQEKHSG
jgi:hypothetical protein